MCLDIHIERERMHLRQRLALWHFRVTRVGEDRTPNHRERDTLSNAQTPKHTHNDAAAADQSRLLQQQETAAAAGGAAGDTRIGAAA